MKKKKAIWAAQKDNIQKKEDGILHLIFSLFFQKKQQKGAKRKTLDRKGLFLKKN
jgi:hypothetical protein